MGLCKCPKRKVTNLFCFEHRVNVCEYCLEEFHSQCVVQTYLSWLKDSDYNPNCSLCAKPLVERETVRLQCLHVFHWDCLDAWARQFPANTAPAGYQCRLCQMIIFPSSNQASPTIERLKSMLQKANWARAGLGLPLLPELDHLPIAKEMVLSDQHQNQVQLQNGSSVSVRSSTPAVALVVEDSRHQSKHDNYFTARKTSNIHDDYIDSSDVKQLITRRTTLDDDLPENKYKRRTAREWLSRWLRSRYPVRYVVDHRSGWKRIVFMAFFGFVVLLTVLTLLSKAGKRPDDDDPAFNPHANPNIRVANVEDAVFNR